MAEGGGTDNGKNTMPIRGKVKQDGFPAIETVRESWAVHEDGAFAYQLQNEEINRHYGMNRFNRRTVREDIPIAKIVQTDEEIKQQNERFEQLQALRAQAEEDERVAKQIMEQEQLQTQAHKMAIELTDESIAKELVEQEHHQLEARKVALELTDEEFAKAVQEKEKQKYERHLEKKKLQKLKKEREKIEKIQAQRTEEARLNVRSDNTEDVNSQMTDLNLQNGGSAMRVTPGGRIEDDGDFSDFYTLPEHVDPAHRQALQEMQDEELAKLLQEQEHKRTKAEVDRNKLREIEEQDKRLAQIIEEQEKIRLKKAKQKWKQQQELKRSQEAAQRPPALPPRNQEHDHRRYRRNSFIQSMENGPEQNDGDDLSPHSLASSEEYLTPVQAADQRNQASQGPRSNSNRQASSDNLLNNSVKQTHEIKQSNQNVQRIRNNTQGPNRVPPSQVPSHEMPDVERWLASHPPDASRGRLPSEDYIPDSPSPPGSYHSEDAFPYRGMSHSPPHNTSTDTGSHYAVSDPFNFNIAAAIDPTYTRRNDTSTERKQVINHGGRSMPQDGHTINTVSSRGDSFHEDGPGVVSPFVPVQGQRRTMGDKQKKSSRNQSGQMSDKQKNNCKQQ